MSFYLTVSGRTDPVAIEKAAAVLQSRGYRTRIDELADGPALTTCTETATSHPHMSEWDDFFSTVRNDLADENIKFVEAAFGLDSADAW